MRAARRPNPCLVCNRQIRWTFLLDHALALGADFMATGHYVRIQRTEESTQLLRAVDRNKDQSYVLHVLTQDKLAKALFPVGDYPKPEIRQIAEKYGLPTASRKDSQDLCFLAGEDYRNFLQRNAADMLQPGKIVSRDGQPLGEHNGLANYTIGQRKGLGVCFACAVVCAWKECDQQYPDRWYAGGARFARADRPGCQLGERQGAVRAVPRRSEDPLYREGGLGLGHAARAGARSGSSLMRRNGILRPGRRRSFIRVIACLAAGSLNKICA